MEAVASDAPRFKFPWQRVQCRQSRLRGVECGIEAGDLGKSGCGINQSTNRRQIVRLMQWRERNERFEHNQYVAGHDDRLPITCAAMNDPMTRAADPCPPRALREHG